MMMMMMVVAHQKQTGDSVERLQKQTVESGGMRKKDNKSGEKLTQMLLYLRRDFCCIKLEFFP